MTARRIVVIACFGLAAVSIPVSRLIYRLVYRPPQVVVSPFHPELYIMVAGVVLIPVLLIIGLWQYHQVKKMELLTGAENTFRFSLRTFVLFVVTSGCGSGVWIRWKLSHLFAQPRLTSGREREAMESLRTFYLHPEFWLVLALTTALLWSLRRDWKGLRTQGSDPQAGQPTGEAP